MKKKCLIVDDIPEYTHTIEFYLEDIFDIDKAHSYEEALKYLDKNNYDLIITDVRLKENEENQDGLKIVEMIKEKSSDTPVIVISGYKDLGYGIQALEKGANYFVEKPINIEEFLQIVKELEKK